MRPSNLWTIARAARACRAALLAAAVVAAVQACDSGGVTAAFVEPPSVTAASVSPGPHNVLSAVVRAEVGHADAVFVRFGVAGQLLDSLSPVTPIATTPEAATSVALPVLGLLPSTAYDLLVIAARGTRADTSDTLRFTTEALPADLPAYAAGGSDPSAGFVVFGSHPYGIVIDNSGRVVWYRRLEQGPTLNFQVQPNGRYTTAPITAPTGETRPWVEYDPLGVEMRRLGCAAGLTSRFHELVAALDGSWWILCDDVRVMDLAAFGGNAAAVVTGTVVQHIDAAGTLLFSWTPFDHFAITDLPAASRSGAAVNWTHGNAIDFDRDGNLLLSFRSLNEITKVDVVSGSVIWRLGGLANQFALDAVTLRFAGQHGLRVTGPGVLQILDNRGIDGDSRAMRLSFDEQARVATMMDAYRSDPPVNALLGGSTQPLPDGRLLVAYGNGNRVQEYDATGAVVWEILGNPGYVFRAQRINSLYRPGVGTPR